VHVEVGGKHLCVAAFLIVLVVGTAPAIDVPEEHVALKAERALPQDRSTQVKVKGIRGKLGAWPQSAHQNFLVPGEAFPNNLQHGQDFGPDL